MQELIPITLAICFAYAIQAVADARARSKLFAPHISEEVITSLVKADQRRSRMSSLRWGLTLLNAAIGLYTLHRKQIDDFGPEALAVLVGSIAVAQLAYYVIAARHAR